MKSEGEVTLYPGDDCSLPWYERVQRYAEYAGLNIETAHHLAAIERGEHEVIPPEVAGD